MLFIIIVFKLYGLLISRQKEIIKRKEGVTGYQVLLFIKQVDILVSWQYYMIIVYSFTFYLSHLTKLVKLFDQIFVVY